MRSEEFTFESHGGPTSRRERRSTIRRTIRLNDDPTEDRRTRLIEIADRCPVHRMLKGTVTIETHHASDD